MSEPTPRKRKARPLLIAGTGIALLTMASGSLSCGNLPAPRCGDGGVSDPCVQHTTTDAGSDAGTDGGP